MVKSTLDDSCQGRPAQHHSKLRLRERIGRLERDDMAAVERAVCLQLGL
jgi:hypothetical protein